MARSDAYPLSLRALKFPGIFLATACLTVLLEAFSPYPAGGRTTADLDAREFLEGSYLELKEVLGSFPADGSGENQERAAAVVGKVFDLEYFSTRILTERWPEMADAEREEFRAAIALSIARYIKQFLTSRSSGGFPELSFESKLTAGRLPSGDEAPYYIQREKDRFWKTGGLGVRVNEIILLRYSLVAPGGKTPLVIAVGRYSDGSIKVTDVFSAGEGIVKLYMSQARRILKKYSLPYLIAELSDRGYITLEDWASGDVGELPPEWRRKKTDEHKRKTYALQQEKSFRYLAADDSGESVIMGKEARWNVRKYPYLSFRWRARLLPEGGDERAGRTNDSAAAISVVFRLRLGLIPESVKYVWSSSLPVGSAVRREGVGRPWVVVAQSGKDHLGEWTTHVFNVYEAYRKIFGREPPEATEGIAILTDANATGSEASADYGEIKALREADAASGITTFMEPL